MRAQTPLEATTQDGYTVTVRHRDQIYCFHPNCGNTTEGAFVGALVAGRSDLLHLHVVRHDEASQLTPQRTVDGHVVKVLGNGSIWCEHPACSPGMQTHGTPVAHPPQHQRIQALQEHLDKHKQPVPGPRVEDPVRGGIP